MKATGRLHATVPVKLKNGVCEIDTKIVSLVKTVDGVHGIRTTYSCQGGHYYPEDCGYLDIAPEDGESIDVCSLFVKHLTDAVMPALAKEEMDNYLRYGSEGDPMLLIHVCTGKFISLTIRWEPEIYKHVLKSAKIAARRMKSHAI